MNTKEAQIKINNAFTDFNLKEKEQNMGKAQDMKQKNEIEVKQKKRYLASTLLDKSFYMKHIFEVWYYLHAEKSYDRI